MIFVEFVCFLFFSVFFKSRVFGLDLFVQLLELFIFIFELLLSFVELLLNLFVLLLDCLQSLFNFSDLLLHFLLDLFSYLLFDDFNSFLDLNIYADQFLLNIENVLLEISYLFQTWFVLFEMFIYGIYLIVGLVICSFRDLDMLLLNIV